METLIFAHIYDRHRQEDRPNNTNFYRNLNVFRIFICNIRSAIVNFENLTSDFDATTSKTLEC